MKMYRALRTTGLIAGPSVLTVSICLLLSVPVFAGGDLPMMEVPGGTAAVSRLLGHADKTPGGFARSVNRILLETIRPDHDWRKHEERVLLSAYIATVRELEANYGPRIELSPAAGQGRRDFARLAARCGYSVHRERGRLVCGQRGGPDARNRRRATLALGWDLAGEAEKLDAGEDVVLEIQRGLAEAPLDFVSWKAVTGRPVDSDTALAELARDQRLGLVLEGLQQVTAETGAFLRDGQLPWIYLEAPSPFYRYAAQLELRQGNLVVPGGSGAEEAWSKLLGVPLTDTAPFIRSLLCTADGRGAYLWQLLSSVSPTVLDELASAGLDQTPPWPERLEKMFQRLGEESDRLAFHRARAPGFSIGDWDMLRLVFPAGPESGWDGQEPISRIVRASGFSAGCSGQGLLSGTRADLSLLLRAEDRTPMALHTLESLCITDPALLRDYLELPGRSGAAANPRRSRLGGAHLHRGPVAKLGRASPVGQAAGRSGIGSAAVAGRTAHRPSSHLRRRPRPRRAGAGLYCRTGPAPRSPGLSLAGHRLPGRAGPGPGRRHGRPPGGAADPLPGPGGGDRRAAGRVDRGLPLRGPGALTAHRLGPGQPYLRNALPELRTVTDTAKENPQPAHRNP